MLSRLSRVPGVLVLAGLAGGIGAQQHSDVSQLPMVHGPGTQGFTVYRGPAIPDFFWFCDTDGTNFDTNASWLTLPSSVAVSE